ncbi:MAG: rod shape-determining protein RodA, partial [Alistipes sp.]|nr:rod shape-determining protein RodA [Alistipes sp.]
MIQQRNNIRLFEGVDRVAILLYLLLVLAGLTCVASAGYDDSIEGFFNFRQNHIKQAMWAGVAFVVGLFILLLDSRYYHMYAYYAYVGALIFTAGTIVMPEAIAPITKGAKAWYELGPVRIQPAEFAKIATALAMARMMSNYSFNIHKASDLCRVAMIILLPFAIILLQNDTGSGVVLCSFIFVLYREGLNKWLCIPIIMVATLFI